MTNIMKVLSPIVALLLISSTAVLGDDNISGNRGANPEKRTYLARTSIQLHDSIWDYYDLYKPKDPQKALYLAVDDPNAYEGWAGGHGTAYDTLSKAKTRALDECNSSRAEWNISAPCILFDENNNFVYVQAPAATPVVSTIPTFSSSTYDIFIPEIKVIGLPFWLELKYSHEINGVLYWQLNGYGPK